MAMPPALKKKIEDASESESSSSESESASEPDAPAAAKKGGKMNPLMAWAKSKRG